MTTLTLPLFDDMHTHFRDGSALARTVTDTSYWCARAVVMPNLTPALDTIESIIKYKERILANLPKERIFEPLMSLYLSKNLTPMIISQAKSAGILAVKWYPRGATTNSAQGISTVKALCPILETMQKERLILLIHGEVTDEHIDIFARESTFVDKVLIPLRKQFPALKMVLEHISTKHAADYVYSEKENLAATITPQHLLFNRNKLLVGGLKPHYYCLPILKKETDRQALISAATSGDKRFFLGTDSAPHAQHAKENSCGCAGCYTAYHAPALYAQIFDQAGKLDQLAEFACGFGADYYEKPRNQKNGLILRKQPMNIPEKLNYADNNHVIPLTAGEMCQWSFQRC